MVSDDGALAGGLGNVAARLQAVIRRHLRRSGASLAAVRTLATLNREGSKRLTDLATIEQVTQPSMSVLVARLESQGLIRRSTDPADGRFVIVSLTEEGRTTLEAVVDRRDVLLAARIGALSASERAAIEAAIPALGHLAELLEDRVSVAVEN